MKKFLVIFLVLMLPFAFAEWKSLDGSRCESPLQVKLLSSTDKEVKVEITIPGYEMRKIMIGDTACVLVNIPGSSWYMERGFPQVPKLTKLIKVCEDCKVTMEVLSKEVVEEVLEAPIVPSRGHFTRDISPDTVPFEFGPIYEKDVYWPCEKMQFGQGECFAFRDAHGLRLQVLPISANHVQMKMKVLKKAVISFKMEHENAYYAPAEPVVPTKTFKAFYGDMFLNYEEPMAYGEVPNPDNRKLVVVTPAQFSATIQDWVAWKKKAGFEVTVNEVADGTSAGTIKSYLQKLYDTPSTRFGYVVLIGDANGSYDFENATPMPTFKGKKEGAAADRVYVRLDGTDNYPDAFISRISGNNEAEIKSQLSKIMEYEGSPKAGEWFVNGTCIASNQGSPSDKERAEWLQNGGGKSEKVPVEGTGLMGHGYMKLDDIYDPYAYAEDVAKAVNEGRSIICYIGHGSSTSWATTGFSVSDIHNLTNDGEYPVIWSVACVNGNFVKTGECFGEAWLRKEKAGAVAIECASTNESWVPPCDKQAQTVNCITGKKFFTFGALEAAGCVKALEVWGVADSTEGN
jgi:hypothetical protein